MSPEVLSLIVALVAVLGVIAGGVFLWMSRTPTIHRDADEMLPLFGMERVEDADPWAVKTPETSAPGPELRPSGAPVPFTGVSEPPGGAGSAAAMAASFAAAAPTGEAPLQEPTPSVMGSSDEDSRRSSFANPAASAPRDVRRSVPDTPVRRPTPPDAPVTPRSSVRTFTTGQGGDARRTSTPEHAVSSLANTKSSPVIGHGVPGTMMEGERLRFSVPADGTLQFLPGRLQISAGLDSGREIRFVNVPGPDGTTVSFGRSEGALYRHIQLRDQTVSRSHAFMQLLNGQWELRNLSQTNPVVHNGRVLEVGEVQLLIDGDRIEMGEVLFTFRDR